MTTRNGYVHEVYFVRRGDVAFFAGKEMVNEEERRADAMISVHMRGPIRDQGRKGSLVRTGRKGKGAVELMWELYTKERG